MRKYKATGFLTSTAWAKIRADLYTFAESGASLAVERDQSRSTT